MWSKMLSSKSWLSMPAEMQSDPQLLKKCQQLCLAKPKTVLLPDAQDLRVLQAACYLRDHRLAKPVLIGSPVTLREFAADHKTNTRGLKVRKPEHDPKFEHFVTMLFEKRKEKGLTRREAGEQLKKPLWYAAMSLYNGQADLSVAGNQSTTADVLRVGLQILSLQAGMETVSSFFMMIAPDDSHTLSFSDCAVVPRPTEIQLADIAISSSRNFEKLTGQEANTAMLSFSSAGSAEHPLAEKVQAALQIIHEKQPGLNVDGEMQFDTALISEVAKKKMPNSSIAGNANVLIFPSLSAGNIGYKIAERMGGYKAIGPFIQGLAKPFYDLSRGCSTEDIVNTVILGSCLV